MLEKEEEKKKKKKKRDKKEGYDHQRRLGEPLIMIYMSKRAFAFFRYNPRRKLNKDQIRKNPQDVAKVPDIAPLRAAGKACAALFYLHSALGSSPRIFNWLFL